MLIFTSTKPVVLVVAFILVFTVSNSFAATAPQSDVDTGWMDDVVSFHILAQASAKNPVKNTAPTTTKVRLNPATL